MGRIVISIYSQVALEKLQKSWNSGQLFDICKALGLINPGNFYKKPRKAHERTNFAETLR